MRVRSKIKTRIDNYNVASAFLYLQYGSVSEWENPLKGASFPLLFLLQYVTKGLLSNNTHPPVAAAIKDELSNRRCRPTAYVQSTYSCLNYFKTKLNYDHERLASVAATSGHMACLWQPLEFPLLGFLRRGSLDCL